MATEPPLKPSPLTTVIFNATSDSNQAVSDAVDVSSHHTTTSAMSVSPITSLVHQNLLHQHRWTSLSTHPSPHPSQPHTLISGVPPRRIYVHPDEQIHMLEQNISELDIAVEREWVVPTWIEEKHWTLKRLAGIFDAIPHRESPEREGFKKEWRGKRVLLAVVDGDSTVIYYLIHDGIVKPRQN
jgi:tRNA-splicing endonuclease subunit Sen15, fungi type